jgi:endoglucanase
MYKIVKMKKFILIDVFLCCMFSFHNLQAQKLSENIKLNQVGYYTHGPKNAIVTGGANEKYFYIREY